MTDTTHLFQLLMLASSNLPIGSFTYSQGVESAIENQLITNEQTAQQFIAQYQQFTLVQFELPLLASMMALQAAQRMDLSEILAEFYISGRDSQEFLLETQQLAQAFRAWITAVMSLNVPPEWTQQGYLPMLARLTHFWQLPIADTLIMYGFSQIENMTLAVVKTLPLGQMAGQRIIWSQNTHLATSAHTIYQQVTAQLPAILATLDDSTQRPSANLTQFSGNTAMQALLDRTSNHSATDLVLSSLPDNKSMHFLPIYPKKQAFLDLIIDKLQLSTTLPALSQLSCQHENQYSRLFRS